MTPTKTGAKKQGTKDGKYWRGTWSTNNGNTWSDHVYTANTRLGLLRLMGQIIDGNLTGPTDYGTLSVYSPDTVDETILDYDDRPIEVLVRTWYSNKWYKAPERY